MNVPIPFCFLECAKQAGHTCFGCVRVNRFLQSKKMKKLQKTYGGIVAQIRFTI